PHLRTHHSATSSVSLSSSSVFYPSVRLFFFFFFNDTATTETYTLSLHDALPIFNDKEVTDFLASKNLSLDDPRIKKDDVREYLKDRKSTRLNSSHVAISYAVFCLKKKNDFVGASFVRNE